MSKKYQNVGPAQIVPVKVNGHTVRDNTSRTSEDQLSAGHTGKTLVLNTAAHGMIYVDVWESNKQALIDALKALPDNDSTMELRLRRQQAIDEDTGIADPTIYESWDVPVALSDDVDATLALLG